jgi:hypothetical protein
MVTSYTRKIHSGQSPEKQVPYLVRLFELIQKNNSWKGRKKTS